MIRDFISQGLPEIIIILVNWCRGRVASVSQIALT